jgi:uncharacterized membrane protein HdeD (DUF308 family)
VTTAYPSPLLNQLRHDLTALRGNWGWFVALGILLMCLGIVALGSVVVASLATAVAIGMLMLIGGAVETAGAFWARHWSGFFLHLLAGVLSVVVGVMFLRAPVGALLALTLLLACLLMVGGLFRIVAALTYRFANRGWPLAGGIIDVILGVMIWHQWPASALWVIGMFLGISLIFRGANWIGLGLAFRGLRRGGGDAAAAGHRAPAMGG